MAAHSAFCENTGNTAAENAMTAIAFLLLDSSSFAWTCLTFVYPVEIFNFTQLTKGLEISIRHHSRLTILGGDTIPSTRHGTQ